MFGYMCQMNPIYERRPARNQVIFHSGDIRSTLNDSLMEKASAIRETALEVPDALLERVKELSDTGNPATREELMNALLHYFLAAGVDEEEIGDLSLDKIPNPQLHRFGLAEDAPVPVYTCKSKYTALIANLGSFVRGRKRTVINSLARSKSHLFMLCEASAINAVERRFLHERGWMTLSNKHGDILIGSRVNDVESSMRRLAGSTLVGVAHEALPCSYMIVEIIYGKTLKVGLQGNRDDFPKASLKTTITRAGSDRIRVCMFHLNSGIAASKIALAHEALGAMYADCLHYQVDLTPIWHFIGPQGVSRSRWTPGEECTRASGTTSLKPG